MAEKEVAKVGVAKPIPAYDVSYAWTTAMLMAATAYLCLVLFAEHRQRFLVKHPFRLLTSCIHCSFHIRYNFDLHAKL